MSNTAITLILISVLASSPTFAETYSECILENMKNASGNAAIRTMEQACENKVMPYIPRNCFSHKGISLSVGDGGIHEGIYYHEDDPVLQSCKKDCLDASYWSKTFGDCKK